MDSDSEDSVCVLESCVLKELVAILERKSVEYITTFEPLNSFLTALAANKHLQLTPSICKNPDGKWIFERFVASCYPTDEEFSEELHKILQRLWFVNFAFALDSVEGNFWHELTVGIISAFDKAEYMHEIKIAEEGDCFIFTVEEDDGSSSSEEPEVKKQKL